MNTKEIANRIEAMCNKKEITVKKMLSECGLNKNVVDNMKKEKSSVPAIDKILPISKYFNVSVDFLLGVDDVPNRKENLKMNTYNWELNGFTNCFVAYLDILGFSNYVTKDLSKEKDSGFKSLKSLFDELERLQRQTIEKSNKYLPNVSNSLKYFIMSDSIIVAIPIDVKYSLDFLIDFCNEIFAFTLVRHKLLIRGGISNGLIYMDDKIVFENQEAKYPRIVLKTEIINKYSVFMQFTSEELNLFINGLNSCEEAGFYETNPLIRYFEATQNNDVKAIPDLYASVFDYLSQISIILNNKTLEFEHMEQKEIDKIVHFIQYFNDMIKEYNLDDSFTITIDESKSNEVTTGKEILNTVKGVTNPLAKPTNTD